MEKKYEFVDNVTVTVVGGHVLRRIRALRDFGYVKAGMLGGWIESESNLSHEGTCWVGDGAMVWGSINVTDDACIYGTCSGTWLTEYATLSGDAISKITDIPTVTEIPNGCKIPNETVFNVHTMRLFGMNVATKEALSEVLNFS